VSEKNEPGKFKISTENASPRLVAAINRAIEVAHRRGVSIDDWLAEAIEYKNNLEAGCVR